MNRFIETLTVGFSAMFAQAIALVPTGLTILVAASIALFQNEARPDWGEMVESSEVGPTSPDEQFDGVDMTVTAALRSDRLVGDPTFFEPGDFVRVIRSVETYAWNETISESTEHNWGGGATITTEVDYHLAWTGDPLHSDGFRYPEGHTNPRPIFDDHFDSGEMLLGGWSLNPFQSIVLYNESVKPSSVSWTPEGEALNYVPSDDDKSGHYYYGAASPHAPQLGDTRISFFAVPTGITMTAVGYGAGETLGGIEWFENLALVPVVTGGREEAQAFMGSIFGLTVWVVRIGGALAVLLGLWFIVGPLFAVLDIIPPLGLVARICAGFLLLPFAAGWAAFIVFLSQLVHSIFMLSVAGFLAYLYVRTVWDRRREERENARARVFYKAWNSQ
ncbi:MAG: hypothetical protein ACJAYU_004916 [Bradymonadia bacterium]|jgi:hypothetical protein